VRRAGDVWEDARGIAQRPRSVPDGPDHQTKRNDRRDDPNRQRKQHRDEHQLGRNDRTGAELELDAGNQRIETDKESRGGQRERGPAAQKCCRSDDANGDGKPGRCEHDARVRFQTPMRISRTCIADKLVRDFCRS
jgi:hypothetical protein